MLWTEESIALLRDAAAINRYYETIAERIAPQLPENAHICDAGCGIGELSLALKPYCHHVTAVDADALAIKTLKAHLIEGVTARCGDMETLAPEKSYDAMVSVSLAARRIHYASRKSSAAGEFSSSSGTIRITASVRDR